MDSKSVLLKKIPYEAFSPSVFLSVHFLKQKDACVPHIGAMLSIKVFLMSAQR